MRHRREILKFWGDFAVGLCAGIIIGLLALFFVGQAQAHMWYPERCCDERDCEPMHIDDVEVTQRGYYLPELDRLVPYAAANSSPDGEYHVCVSNFSNTLRQNYQADPSMNRSTLCFWAPDGAI